jgi:translation initiation factor IF-2
MKIHELAKELNMPNKDVIAKAGSMGIEAKSHMSNLSEEDALALKNLLVHGGGITETKIVKVAPKTRSTDERDEVVRVTKKANLKPPIRQQKAKPQEDARSADVASASKKGAGASASAKKTERTAGAAGRKSAEVRPAAQKTAASNHVADGSAPARIPASQLVPKRISREVLEAEERAKQSEDLTVNAPEISDAAVAAEKKPKPEMKKKAVLKVAWTDTGKTKPTEEPAKPTKRTEEAAQPKEDAPVAASASDAVPSPAEQPTGEAVASEKPAERKDAKKTPEQKAAVSPEHRAGKPGDKKKASGQDKKAPGQKDESKAKRPQSAPKSKDKKPHKGKDGKPGESFGDKGRKHGVKGERKRGVAEPFRGPAKSPAVEGKSLEKRPLRSRPRPKSQPKAEPEKIINYEELAPGTKIIHVPITVAGFAEQVEKTNSEVIMALMKLGIMANINQNLDETTVQLLGEELDISVFIGSDAGEIVEEGLEIFEDNEDDLVVRPPIITVMGHVDHGKTSLLDAIRKTNVTGGEAGGITQHIGASEVRVNGEKIVFLDTPGHEAFTAMRARGAHVTDIAVLVVAADDGVMPQTIESISHARAAGVPIIVAINKIDKEGANPDKVKQELADHGILVEEWGGDTISVPVSAKSGEGIVNLLEMILLQAEVLELRANPNRLALGTVIEARLDKARGAVATLLVLNGTLEAGMSIVAGNTSGRIRAMSNYNGKRIKKAGPSGAVEVIGLNEVPQAGDEFNAVREDKTAREIAESRRVRQREEIMSRTSGASLETLFNQISENEIKELNIIIKGDVQGSVGALTASLEKLSDEQVKVRIIHTGVGAVTESDVMLANTSRAVIIGFNVRPGSSVTGLAEQEGVEIRTYRVIYDAIADVDAAMKGLLDPEFREVVLGKIEIRELFKVPGAGVIGGAYVLEGKVQRNADVRIVRDGIVIHEGKISSLRRFKDDVREVAAGYECGIGIENYNDIKEGDIIEAFMMEEIER